jgi:LDH2 family malate/lactate/ureidoglycolate dehydrogenase
VVTEERLDPEALRTIGSAVLSALGVPGDDAALVADSLVQADLWGHSSHGLLRLPWYAARLRSGAMRAVTDPAVLSDTGPLVLLDGRDGVGQVLTDRARAMATDRARSTASASSASGTPTTSARPMWFTDRGRPRRGSSRC